MGKTYKRRTRNPARRRGGNPLPRIHFWDRCWCGSNHDHEKTKHGTVNGLTFDQINAVLDQQGGVSTWTRS